MLVHLRAGLGAEVLDDDLLHVAVALVEVTDGVQRLEPLEAGLADADQDPAREGDAQLACEPQRLEPDRRELVGRAEVGAAALGEPPRRRLQHDPLRGRRAAQQRQLLGRHDAGVGVGEEAGLVQHELRHAGEVLDRRLAPERLELLAGGPVAALGLVAEREEGLVTARRRAGLRDREHLVGGHVGTLAPFRRLRERAVVADVAAELRQRDEDLRREGDDGTVAALA